MTDAIIPRIWMPPLWEVGDGIIPTDGQCELDDVSYILATPEALASSPEVAALIREAEARGMERAAEWHDSRRKADVAAAAEFRADGVDDGSVAACLADALCHREAEVHFRAIANAIRSEATK